MQILRDSGRGFSSFPYWTLTQNSAVTKFFRNFPNTYHILFPLPEIKGPVQVAPTVSRSLESCSRSQGIFTVRVNFIPLQQNLPCAHSEGSSSHGEHFTSSTPLPSCEGIIWDWAIFQQEHEKDHNIIRALHQSSLAD